MVAVDFVVVVPEAVVAVAFEIAVGSTDGEHLVVPVDVVLVNVGLTGADLADAALEHVALVDAEPMDVVLKDVVLKDVVPMDVVLKDVVPRDVVLKDVDLNWIRVVNFFLKNVFF